MTKLLGPALLLLAACGPAQRFDTVIQGGRVIDPETGLDRVMNVGIHGGSIAVVSERPLQGAKVIDAAGLIVAPGFIDLHQHQHDSTAYRLKAQDGVTTALEMESGVPDIERFLAGRAGKALINYGATASQEAARVAAWGEPLAPSTSGPDAAIDDPPSGPSTNDPATDEQLQRQLDLLTTQLDRGALGIGIGLEYTPGATRLEIIRIFQLAATRRLPVYVHMRSIGSVEPGSSIESVGEMIAATAVSGAPVHIVHLNSSCGRLVRACLEMIEGARSRGLFVTTEAYPYGAGMTSIASALFNPGWNERRGIGYDAIELPETGERLTKARFDELHGAGRAVNVLIHTNPDSIVDVAITSPLTLIASDGLSSHPRNAGTYARVLARQVRERKSLTLIEAIRKMALMPAQVLERSTSAARAKGRIQAGADADIIVFDLERVQDQATYRQAGAPSVGMRHVLVAGVAVITDGKLVDGVAPGRAVTARRLGFRP